MDWIQATTPVPFVSTAVCTSAMSAPEGSTVAVRGSDVRAPSAAPMFTLVEMPSVSIDQAPIR